MSYAPGIAAAGRSSAGEPPLTLTELGILMNLRRIAPATLLISAALALAGCGGSTAPASTGGAPATGSQGASVAASQTPTPTPTAEAKTYTRGDLAAIIAGLKDAEGKRLTAIPASQLDQGITASKEMMKAVKITPAACAAVADSNAQIPAGSTYASGTSQAAKVQAATAVTLVAFKDPAVLAKNLDESAVNSNKCSDFTMEIQGQKVTNKTVVLPVETKAEKSYSAMMTQNLPNNMTISTVVVMGVRGGLAATAVATGPGVTKAAAADLARMVNEVFASQG